MKQKDWQQVRTIYMEGIGTGNAAFESDIPGWGKWDSAHLQEHRLLVKERDIILAWAALKPVSNS